MVDRTSKQNFRNPTPQWHEWAPASELTATVSYGIIVLPEYAQSK
jgi:hypothetical protein